MIKFSITSVSRGERFSHVSYSISCSGVTLLEVRDGNGTNFGKYDLKSTNNLATSLPNEAYLLFYRRGAKVAYLHLKFEGTTWKVVEKYGEISVH